jgi:ABC-type multidrug transport system fused ATPase/permease subunit
MYAGTLDLFIFVSLCANLYDAIDEPAHHYRYPHGDISPYSIDEPEFLRSQSGWPVVTRITNDVDALNDFITQGTVALLGDLVRLLFIVVTMLVLSWRLALVSFCIFPVVILSTIIFQRIMRTTYRVMRQRLARINAYLNEQITGVLVTQLFRREESSRAFFRQSEEYLQSQFRSNNTFAVFFPTIYVTSVMASAVLLTLGGNLVLGNYVDYWVVGGVYSIYRPSVPTNPTVGRPLQYPPERYGVVGTSISGVGYPSRHHRPCGAVRIGDTSAW